MRVRNMLKIFYMYFILYSTVITQLQITDITHFASIAYNIGFDASPTTAHTGTLYEIVQAVVLVTGKALT